MSSKHGEQSKITKKKVAPGISLKFLFDTITDTMLKSGDFYHIVSPVLCFVLVRY